MNSLLINLQSLGGLLVFFWRLQQVLSLGENIVVAHRLLGLGGRDNGIEWIWRLVGILLLLFLAHHLEQLQRDQIS